MPVADTSTLRLATRGSALALRQTWLAAHALQQAVPGSDLETLVVRTEGDRRVSAPIDQLEGQGWFTADLERSLLDGAHHRRPAAPSGRTRRRRLSFRTPAR